VILISCRATPLSFYPCSKNQATLKNLVSRVNSGNVVTNDAIINMAVSDIPFGGVGESGMGNYHGIHGFHTFSRTKAVMHRKTPESIGAIRYQTSAYRAGVIRDKVLPFLLNKKIPSTMWLKLHRFFKKSWLLFYVVGLLGAFLIGYAVKK
jgi:hypothetical protein